MPGRRVKERKESRGPQGSPLQPLLEYWHLARARVQMLSQSQKSAALGLARAGERYGQSCHEETWPCCRPSRRVQITRMTQLNEIVFIGAINAHRKMAVSSHIARAAEHSHLHADCQRQGMQGPQVATLPAPKSRQGLLPYTSAGRPCGIRETQAPRLPSTDWAR